MNNDVIASDSLVAVNKATGEKVQVEIKIFRPEKLENLPGGLTQAICAYEISGLYPRLMRSKNLSTFDVLSSACEVVKVLLQAKAKDFDIYYTGMSCRYFDENGYRP